MGEGGEDEGMLWNDNGMVSKETGGGRETGRQEGRSGKFLCRPEQCQYTSQY